MRVGRAVALVGWLLATGLLLFVDSWVGLNLYWQVGTSSYNRADGRVTSSDVERASGAEGAVDYAPKVTYEYSVEHVDYHGTRLRFDLFPYTSDRAYAEAVVGPLRPENSIAVFYDPRRPDRAVLQAGLQGSDVLILFLLGPLTALGLARAWFAFANTFRRRRRELPSGTSNRDVFALIFLGTVLLLPFIEFLAIVSMVSFHPPLWLPLALAAVDVVVILGFWCFGLSWLSRKKAMTEKMKNERERSIVHEDR